MEKATMWKKVMTITCIVGMHSSWNPKQKLGSLHVALPLQLASVGIGVHCWGFREGSCQVYGWVLKIHWGSTRANKKLWIIALSCRMVFLRSRCSPGKRIWNVKITSFKKENHLLDLHFWVSCLFSWVYIRAWSGLKKSTFLANQDFTGWNPWN